ncbi:unnamed protein product [Meloidogyne enterolobii]|uniref:Uncharacterized protein n=1 Tax=Meloidogyne enterolobii TaxID=390850 RepID=A0ACB1AE25_MELEN
MPCDKASVLSTFAVKLGVGVCGIGISGVVNLVEEIVLVWVDVVVNLVVGILVLGENVVLIVGFLVVWERLFLTSLPLVHCLLRI